MSERAQTIARCLLEAFSGHPDQSDQETLENFIRVNFGSDTVADLEKALKIMVETEALSTVDGIILRVKTGLH